MKTFPCGLNRVMILLLGLLISALLSSSIMAVDCTSDYIELNSQNRIDSFQRDYGGGGTCDTVPGTLRIGGPDVVDLTPLSALTTVRDQFQIRQTNNLTDLNGLSALTSVGGDKNDAAGSFYIFDNAALTNFNGLSGLTSVGGSLYINDNPVMISLDGMLSLTSVNSLEIGNNDSLTDLSGISALVTGNLPWSLALSGNDSLTHLDDLSGLTGVGGDLSITHNYALANVDGLSALTFVNRALDIRDNTALTNLDGMSSLASVGGLFQIIGNTVLANIDGLSALREAGSVSVKNNLALADCLGIVMLVDPIDDYEPGPGPGASGIPDVANQVTIQNNLGGCNTLAEILGVQINAGLNDAWYSPLTDGQGFLIAVFPDIGQMFLAWFTFDTERPPEDVQAVLGEPGHRWLTAQGPYEGDTANLTIFVTSGGVFDSEEPPAVTDPAGDGTLTIEFADCANGLVSYEITSLGISGEIPIERIALDNVSLCETLSGQ